MTRRPSTTKTTWAAIIWTVLIFVICWTPSRNLPISEHAPSFLKLIHADKIVHATIFAVFGFLWRRGTTAPSSIILAAGVALAVITELGQGTPFVGRDADVWDGLADILGLILGILSARMPKPPLAIP